MREQSKKRLVKWYNVVLLLLAAVFTVTSFLPVVVLDANRTEYPELFYEARYTSHMTPVGEIELGYGTVFSLVTNFSDFITLVTIQSNEGYVNNSSERLQELRDEEASEEEIEDFLEDVAETRKTLEEDLEALTEADHERIIDKVKNDDGFRSLVSAVYFFAASATSDEDGDVIEESATAYGINPMPLLGTILFAALTIGLIGIALIYPIILVFKLIAQIIHYLKHLKDDDLTVIERRMERFPISGYCGAFISMLVLFMLFAPDGITVGAGVVSCIIVWLVGNVFRAVKHIVLDEPNKPLALGKQAMAVVTIVAALIMLVNFSGLNLVSDLEDAIPSMSGAHYAQKLDTLDGDYASASELSDAAESAVTLANMINTAVVLLVALGGIGLMIGTVVSSVERMGYKLQKLRNGEREPYKAMRGLAITLLVFTLLPILLFSAGSEEALEDAYADGNFKVWHEAYLEKGTPENVEYRLLVETRDDLEDAVEDMDEDDEAYEPATQLLASLEDQIDDIEAKSSRGIISVVMTVIMLIAEFLYHFMPKFFPAGKKEEPVPVATGTEESFEPAPAEEIPAEVPAEEIPAEAPAEEAPAEEIPAEAPVEEAPAEPVAAAEQE